MPRRILLFLSLVMLPAPPTLAVAAEPQPYEAKAFAEAQAAGGPILVQVQAPWCPVCAKQRPILAELEKTAELGDLTVFNIDFDSQKDLLKEFGVQKQSTLIVFSGKTEKGRSTGVSDAT